MEVQVNKDSLDNNCSKIKEYITSFDADIDRSKAKIEEIASVWQGSDYDAFKEKTTSFFAELEKMKESLDKYQDFVVGYTSAIKELDDHYGNKSISMK